MTFHLKFVPFALFSGCPLTTLREERSELMHAQDIRIQRNFCRLLSPSRSAISQDKWTTPGAVDKAVVGDLPLVMWNRCLLPSQACVIQPPAAACVASLFCCALMCLFCQVMSSRKTHEKPMVMKQISHRSTGEKLHWMAILNWKMMTNPGNFGLGPHFWTNPLKVMMDLLDKVVQWIEPMEAFNWC